MKKFIGLAFIAALSLAGLTGCGDDDNGKLAGTYDKIKTASDSSTPAKMVIEYKKPDYNVSYVFGNSSPKFIGVMSVSGNYLVKSDNKEEKMFEVKNDGNELVSLYTSSLRSYLKQGQ